MDQEACLIVDDDEMDVSGDGPPMTATSYLRQVREGRKKCPDVVKADIGMIGKKNEQTKKAWEGTSQLNMKDEVFETTNTLIAPRDWQKSKSEGFALNRQRVNELKESGRVTPLRFKKFNTNDDDAWHEILLERCTPEAESLLHEFPNHVGTPPSLSIVFGIAPRLVNDLICLLVEWSDSEGLTRPIREWLYSFLLVVELPLLPNVHAALRTLSNNAKRSRACLSPQRFTEANEFSLFVAIVANFFEQKDLDDYKNF